MQTTRKEAEKEIREEAKKVGLTFKVDSTIKMAGKTAYKFCDRISGREALTHCSFWSAYENVQSGYVGSYDKEKGRFEW